LRKPAASSVVRLWLQLHANLVGAAIILAFGLAFVGLVVAINAPTYGHFDQPMNAVVTGVVSRKTKSEAIIRAADGGFGLVDVRNVQFCRIGSSVIVLKRKTLLGYTYVASVDSACALK